MGLVLLNVQFRIEKELHITLPDDWIGSIDLHKTGDDCTIATLEHFLADQIGASGAQVPTDLFERLQKILAEVSGVSRQRITRDTFLVRELLPGAG